jgi:DNA sulfur modification protein DndD
MTYYTPREDVKPESIVLDGKNYDLVKRSPNKFEYTELREVIHA